MQKWSRTGAVALKDRLLKMMEKFQAWRYGFKTPVKRLKTKNSRMKKKGEEELKFKREQMKMKLEFECELEETKVNWHPAVKAEQSQRRAKKLPKLEIAKFKGRTKDSCLFGTNFTLKSTRQA